MRSYYIIVFISSFCTISSLLYFLSIFWLFFVHIACTTQSFVPTFVKTLQRKSWTLMLHDLFWTYFKRPLTWNPQHSCLLFTCQELIDEKDGLLVCFFGFQFLGIWASCGAHGYWKFKISELVLYLLDLTTTQFPQKNAGVAEKLMSSCCEVSIKWFKFWLLTTKIIRWMKL